MNLKNKKVLVTGGADGLGLSITKALLKKGAIVYICGLSKQHLITTKNKLKNKNLSVYQCDVADYIQIEKMIGKIGSIDVLINNAGIWLSGELDNHTPQEINRVVDTNTRGVILMTRAVLPQMRKRNQGYILNISSTSGLREKKGQSVYVASKYAVTGFTESLKLDLEETKIKVAGFYPGGMNTNLFKKAHDIKDVSQWMQTNKVAEIIVFILERDDTLVMNQVVLNKRI